MVNIIMINNNNTMYIFMVILIDINVNDLHTDPQPEVHSGKEE